jgi:RNA polymerase sigma-70 factor (ECF subfamily)
LPIDRRYSSEEFDLPGEGRLHEISPRDHLTCQELDEEMSLALSMLPGPWREVFIMAVFQDYSYEEMAEELLCPIGTIRSRLSRAKNVLRQRLSKSARRYGYCKN